VRYQRRQGILPPASCASRRSTAMVLQMVGGRAARQNNHFWRLSIIQFG
jgi:hypothetical protein